jgi:hypothetical protein
MPVETRLSVVRLTRLVAAAALVVLVVMEQQLFPAVAALELRQALLAHRLLMPAAVLVGQGQEAR